MIQITDISKVFRTSEVETVALNHVSLEVKEGEFVAIMGPRGAANLLAEYSRFAGHLPRVVSVEGEEMAGLKEKERT